MVKGICRYFNKLWAATSSWNIVVPRYKVQSLIRQRDIYKTHSDNLDKGWLNTIKNLEEVEKTKNTIRSYAYSVSLTIDSLIGELIMRGVTEDEIAEMFDRKWSYQEFLDITTNIRNKINEDK